MRAFLVSIIALAAMVCAGGLRSEAASTWPSMSWTGDQAGPSSNLVVKVKKKKKKHNDGGNDQKQDDGGNDQKQDDGGNTIQQGERSCPEGYVVLKEKNMYGNFCEPKVRTTPASETHLRRRRNRHAAKLQVSTRGGMRSRAYEIWLQSFRQ